MTQSKHLLNRSLIWTFYCLSAMSAFLPAGAVTVNIHADPDGQSISVFPSGESLDGEYTLDLAPGDGIDFQISGSALAVEQDNAVYDSTTSDSIVGLHNAGGADIKYQVAYDFQADFDVFDPELIFTGFFGNVLSSFAFGVDLIAETDGSADFWRAFEFDGFDETGSVSGKWTHAGVISPNEQLTLAVFQGVYARTTEKWFADLPDGHAWGEATSNLSFRLLPVPLPGNGVMLASALVAGFGWQRGYRRRRSKAGGT